MAQLEAELDKVFTFQRVKSGEIVRRIKSTEREVNDVIARLDASGSESSGQYGNAGGPQAPAPSEEDFLLLEEDLSDIIADVHDLAKFTQLNYTGFQKIIKKHDVGANSECLLHPDEAHWLAETNLMAFKTGLCYETESQAIL